MKDDPAKTKILIIENLTSDENIRHLFPLDNYEIKVSVDFDKALIEVKNWEPDLIFLDEFPEALEYEEASRKIEAESNSKPVIILLTENMSQEISESGIFRIISKKSNENELISQLNDIIDLKRKDLELDWTKTLLKKEKRILKKYFSEDLVEQILDNEDLTSLGGAKQEASILFFDIRGSTTIAESIDAEVFASFLSEFFTDLMDLVYGNRGSVNKMLGDGIMATFGCPIGSDQDVLNAVKCAVQIREHIMTFNDVRPDFLVEPLAGGIGISTGNVFAGNIGSVRRMEYTVLGDAVNTAARLESMTKEAKVDILIDGETRNKLGNLIKVKKVKFDKVRGKLNHIDIYYLDKVLV